jgi:peptidyl-prolyl cis-trans isomerase SurA
MKCLCILLAAGTLWTLPLRADLADAIEAIVDDAVITYHEVNAINQDNYNTLLRRYRNQPETLERELTNVRSNTLVELMDRKLILHDFKTAGYSLPESVIDDLVQARIKSVFGDRVTMAKTLESNGITQEKYRQQVRETFIVDQLRLKNVASEIIISPHKIESYYQAHRDEFKVEDEAKLRVIVLKAGDTSDTNAAPPCLKAEDLLAQIKSGTAFADLAARYSQGSQRGQGGDWGWWEKNQLTKGLADVAFSLSVGKCSGVFSRSSGDDYWVVQYEHGQPASARHYGVDSGTKKQVLLEERRCADGADCTNLPPAQEYYLLKLEDLHTAHYKSLGEVRDQIEKNLLLNERNRLNQQWIDRLKKKTFVRTFS